MLAFKDARQTVVPVRSPCHDTELTRVDGYRTFWRCRDCKGFALNASVLTEALGKKDFATVWQGVRNGQESPRRCSSCPNAMRQTIFGVVTLDGCTTCNLLWFDQDEWAATLRGVPHPLDVTTVHHDEDVRALKDSREPHRVGVKPFFLKPRPTPIRDLLADAALREPSSLEMATRAFNIDVVTGLHELATLLQIVYLIFEDYLPVDDTQPGA